MDGLDVYYRLELNIPDDTVYFFLFFKYFSLYGKITCAYTIPKIKSNVHFF